MISSRNLLEKVLELHWRLSTRFREKSREGRENECLNQALKGFEGFCRVNGVGRTFVANIVGYLVNRTPLPPPFPSLTEHTLYSDFCFRQRPSRPIISVVSA